MLSFLRIENFAIIESLHLELGGGLTVLTGETGAGKSIILAAMNLLLGERAAGDLIRHEADEAVVEALFDLAPDSPAVASLTEAGFALAAEDWQLSVRRLVSRAGKNRVQLAGGLATLGTLAGIGSFLVSICGQHAHQSLLRPEEHLALLDAYAGVEDLAQETALAVKRALALERRLKELEKALSQRESRRAWLMDTIAEIARAKLDPAEEAALKEERELLVNSERIAKLAEGVHLGLYTSEGSALEVLSGIRDALNDLADLDPKTKGPAERLQEAYYLMEDVAGEMVSYASNLGFEAGRQDFVESRLAEIRNVCRKHGGGMEEALQTLAQAQEELAALDDGDLAKAKLEKEKAAALAEALRLAGELSAGRRAAADKLARAVEGELADLAMSSCRFEVRFAPPAGSVLPSQRGPLSQRGLESAEFFIAPNPGEGFRQLKRIASGGELSRLLLALKNLAAQKAAAGTLVFDEVDAGIGGLTGSAVGRKLTRLAQTSQVIVITHLPQIAAFADKHITVTKKVDEGRTATVLTPLDRDGQVTELTRMLAGEGEGETARAHARELLEAAAAAKKKIA